jgi:hypothetical protein
VVPIIANKPDIIRNFKLSGIRNDNNIIENGITNMIVLKNDNISFKYVTACGKNTFNRFHFIVYSLCLIIRNKQRISDIILVTDNNMDFIFNKVSKLNIEFIL